MLEYTLDEAIALLSKNGEAARANLAILNEDLAFLRDQIVTTEVSIRQAAALGGGRWWAVSRGRDRRQAQKTGPLDLPPYHARSPFFPLFPRSQTLLGSTTGTSSNEGCNGLAARRSDPSVSLCTNARARRSAAIKHAPVRACADTSGLGAWHGTRAYAHCFAAPPTLPSLSSSNVPTFSLMHARCGGWRRRRRARRSRSCQRRRARPGTRSCWRSRRR